MGQVIAITSGKGGTGKTTLCAALGTCLAAEGARVLCVDADSGLRNLDISLGMEEVAPISFADVLSGRCSLSDATPHPDIPKLWMLTAPSLEYLENVSEEDFDTLLEAAREIFDYVLVDSPAGIGDGFRFAVHAADRVVVVATPDPASLRDAAGASEQLRHLGRQDIRLVVNRVTPAMFRALHWTVDDVMDEVGLPLLGIVPEDDRVVLAAASDMPLIRYTDLGAALGCLHIARRLQGKRVPLLKIR